MQFRDLKRQYEVLKKDIDAQIAEVIEIGPGGVDENGKEIKMQVKKGDKVITSKYSGTEVKYQGVEYIIVKQSDILAIVE